MTWIAMISAGAESDLRKLPRDVSEKITLRMKEIAADNPYRHLEELRHLPYYKFRVGRYRAIVDIINGKMVLVLIKAGHRSAVYRNIR